VFNLPSARPFIADASHTGNRAGRAARADQLFYQGSHVGLFKGVARSSQRQQAARMGAAR